jgi:hypothetical protein
MKQFDGIPHENAKRNVMQVPLTEKNANTLPGFNAP